MSTATDWETELLEAALPETLTLNDRCDRCGAAALHAYRLTAGLVLLCNHHGRASNAKLMAAPHRDYRLTPEQSAAHDRATQEAAQKEASKPGERGVTRENNWRPVPVHLTQWDLEWWGAA